MPFSNLFSFFFTLFNFLNSCVSYKKSEVLHVGVDGGREKKERIILACATNFSSFFDFTLYGYTDLRDATLLLSLT